MSIENAVIGEIEILNETESFDFDELEAKLQGQLEEELTGLELSLITSDDFISRKISI